MRLKLDYQTINTIDLSHLVQQFPWENRDQLVGSAGHEFHKLYAHIAGQFNGIKIADIGARTGNSALSLSCNMNNQIDSYEIFPEYYNLLCTNINKSNISFFFEDILTDPKILSYPLISLDVDPHDGVQESKCFEYLMANNYQGLVLLDDTNFAHVYPALHNWWNGLQLPKWDLTRYGHYSGTGLVDFSGTVEVILS